MLVEGDIAREFSVAPEPVTGSGLVWVLEGPPQARCFPFSMEFALANGRGRSMQEAEGEMMPASSLHASGRPSDS